MYEVIENALDELGIAIADNNGNYRNFIDIIIEIQETMAGLDNEQKDIIRRFFL